MNTHKLPYELHIKNSNLQFHKDLDADMVHKGNGMFSFVIKLNNGDIIDYITLDYESTEGLEL